MKKIAYGAYYLSVKQGNGKFTAYLSFLLIMGAIPVFWFLLLSFVLAVFFKIFLEYPLWLLLIGGFAVSILSATISRNSLETLLENQTEVFKSQCINAFWIGIFLPMGLFLIIALSVVRW
jgi:hypothetical protein